MATAHRHRETTQPSRPRRHAIPGFNQTLTQRGGPHWLVAAAWLGAAQSTQAQATVNAAGTPQLLSWVWPALVVLLVLAVLMMAGVCLTLLRRDRELRSQLELLQTQTRSAIAAPSAVSEADKIAAVAPLPQTDQEHESFSYTVSHDLRAPIRVVEGFTRILKEDYGRVLDRVGNDHLDRVLGAAARMNSMIDSLLALSRLSSQPLARQPVNLSQLASYVADDLRRQSPDRNVKISIEEGMQVTGDPVLLRIVVENLIGNAWKYTGKCEQAEISFHRHPSDARTFSICDNGAGFDMRFADRLFGVFQRLHSANDFQGTGIGLASVRRVLRRHNGEIWAESEINQGARFHFSVKLD